MMVVINSLRGNLDDAIVMIVKHEVNEIGNKIRGRKERWERERWIQNKWMKPEIRFKR